MPPDHVIEDFDNEINNSLTNSNLIVEFVDINQEKNQPILDILKDQGQIKFPVALLLSPENDKMIIPITDSFQNFEKDLLEIKNMVVESPVRNQILSEIIDSFCVILLIEGNDNNQNRMIRNLVSKVSESFNKTTSLIEVPQEIFDQEKILIWSLGLKESNIHEPHLVVLHGKMKRIGPGLIGNGITEGALFSIFFVLEADCECGLDRSWMTGTRLPSLWDQEKQRQVMVGLGFDAENPLVKMEVGRILGQIPSSGIKSRSLDDLSAVRESHIPEQRNIINYFYSIYFVGGIIIIVLLTGITILWRARRRSK